MFQEWWNRLVAWFTGSTPQGELEVVEQSLTDEAALRDLWNEQEAWVSSGRGRYGQVLRGGGKPSDRARNFADVLQLPGNVDWWIDEYEGPEGKGWTLRALVTQGFMEHILSVDKDKGSLGWVSRDTRVVP